MPVITANVACRHQKKTRTDMYGQENWSDPVQLRCAVVKLEHEKADTTVRADSSGTRGHADEKIAAAILLFKRKHGDNIALGDRLEVGSISLSVIKVRQRYDVMSRLDHYEVWCAIE